MTSTPSEDVNILTNVKDYYGKQLQCTADLKTQACVSTATNLQPARIKAALDEIHEEVVQRYYGCGLVIPEKLVGMHVLDLGSGSGRDCFAISKLIGQNGHVTGVDMTDEQLTIANKHIGYHTEKFGYQKENVKFVKGYIEKLSEAGIQPDSMDIIVSNCVVNLSPDKRAVLSEAYSALKVGGELYFSDVYADRKLSDEIRKHEVLWGECISGALWWEELNMFAESVGFSAPRLVTSSPIDIDREDFKQILGEAKFVSATYRLFKLPTERAAAGAATYKGGIAGFETQIDFDHQTQFKICDIKTLDSEMMTILQSSRFKDDFDLESETSSGKKRAWCCSTVSSKSSPFKFVETQEKAGKTIKPACCGPSKCC